jgi:thiol-disulfide isomerase/thioredoxin
MKIPLAIGPLLAVALLANACSPSSSPSTGSPTAAATAFNVASTEPAASTSQASSSGAVDAPNWQTAGLTNATTGKSFTLADFRGKAVYVETFATWCGECRVQLGHVKEARAELGDDIVVVSLSVEPNIGDVVLEGSGANSLAAPTMSLLPVVGAGLKPAPTPIGRQPDRGQHICARPTGA